MQRIKIWLNESTGWGKAGNRSPQIILILSIAIVSACFLLPNAVEFPMDDTYIHFVYAQNLVERGQLMYNVPGETGVGSTSLLWVGLLAGAYRLGQSFNLAAKALGLLSLILLGTNLFALLRPFLGEKLSLLTSLLVVLSGNMIWFSLSGMETMLFLAIGVIGLRLHQQRRWALLGIALGLLILTRPEGTALAVAIGIMELRRERKIKPEILVVATLTVAISAPWFFYLLMRTGELLPTSVVGKQLSMEISIRYALAQNNALNGLSQIPALVYLVMWAVFLFEFVLGGMAYPLPGFTFTVNEGTIPYFISLWAIAGWVGALAPILWFAGRKIITRLKQRREAGSIPHPYVMLTLWGLLHNLTYIIVLPVPGTASRYGSLNHLLLWAGLAFTIFRLVPTTRYRNILAGWLLVTAAANTYYWNGVYDANLVHMQEVRIQAADYVRKNLVGELCAVSDIGAIRFFSQAPIFDIGGLVDPDLGEIFLAGKLDQHVAEHGATCLIVPGRSGTSADGYVDSIEILGFKDSQYFDLEELQVFEIDRDTWLHGYLPTLNYQATVTVYRLHRPAGP